MRLFNFIQDGGPIMYILVVLNIVGFAIMFSKFFLFGRVFKNSSSIAESLKDNVKKVLKSSDPNTIIEYSKQELSNHIDSIEGGLNTVKIIASISPLLGLLGTVIGVLVSFRMMSQTGLNDPASFAQGISMALITTVGGMIVAIPHYIGHSYLLGMLDRIENRLEKDLLLRVL